MALENATFINQLVPTNPTGADPVGAGDDHLRMVKRVLQATFPNLTGAVTMTQAQLNTLGTPNLFVFPGMIVMWSGALNALPAGWKLCNGVGTISTGLSVPDLRDKFIAGAGASLAVRTVGGSNTHTHATTIAVTPTALTIAQIPAHDHIVGYGTQTPDGSDSQGQDYEPLNPVNYPGVNNRVTSKTGSGAPHGHTATATVSAVNHLPPYMALGFIIKD